MRTATNRTVVVVRHPVTDQFVSVKRGDEFADTDPIATDPGHAWLFEDEEAPPAEVTSVPIPQVEQATRNPGEARRNRQR